MEKINNVKNINTLIQSPQESYNQISQRMLQDPFVKNLIQTINEELAESYLNPYQKININISQCISQNRQISEHEYKCLVLWKHFYKKNISMCN